MKVTVSRKRWGRGDTGGKLLRDGGKMCCLGFGCRQTGIRASVLKDTGLPATLFRRGQLRDKEVVALAASPFIDADGADSALSVKASTINDNDQITDRSREQQLRECFKLHGHQIVFKP